MSAAAAQVVDLAEVRASSLNEIIARAEGRARERGLSYRG